MKIRTYQLLQLNGSFFTDKLLPQLLLHFDSFLKFPGRNDGMNKNRHKPITKSTVPPAGFTINVY